MNFIMIAVLVLGAIALIAALVLFGVSKKFAVEEDPRLGQVGELLPGANCGGCGFAGCSGMAAALVKGADAGSIEGLMCPVGGAEVMGKVADLLGIAVANTEAKVAVVRCNGSCENRPRIAEYDGLHTCAAMNSCGAGHDPWRPVHPPDPCPDGHAAGSAGCLRHLCPGLFPWRAGSGAL